MSDNWVLRREDSYLASLRFEDAGAHISWTTDVEKAEHFDDKDAEAIRQILQRRFGWCESLEVDKWALEQHARRQFHS